jgi:AcrR family transcriptional regulator
VVHMPRQTREQIDDEIIDGAATLFARHGFAETSVQRVADAVGYSKTGLLHRFPTKEALQDAVVARWTERVGSVVDEVRALPLGPDRDRAVLAALIDLAVRRPGVTALMLTALMSDDDLGGRLPTEFALFEAFGVDPDDDTDRAIRVGAALAAITVVSVAASRVSDPTEFRTDLLEAAYDALGHHRPKE